MCGTGVGEHAGGMNILTLFAVLVGVLVVATLAASSLVVDAS